MTHLKTTKARKDFIKKQLSKFNTKQVSQIYRATEKTMGKKAYSKLHK